MDRLPVKVKIIIVCTTIMAVLGGILSYGVFGIDKGIWDILFFAFLAIICESLVIVLPNQMCASVVFALAVSVIMIFPPLTASMMIALANTSAIIKRDGKYYHIFNTPFYKTLFNASNVFFSTTVGAVLYRALGGPTDYIILSKAVLPIFIGSLVYIFINTSFLTLLISSLFRKSFKDIWENNVKWVIPNFVTMVPLGIILAIAFQNYGYLGVLLFFGPLLMARYSFKLYMDLRRSYLETVRALSKAMEAKDPVTSGHSERISRYAVAIAREMRLSENRIDKIRYAGLLHDIGKIGIADDILKKPGKLNEEEFKQIKEHPVIGAEILNDIDYLRDVAKVIHHHHERYDGKGYPDGTKREEIPIESYILAVVDAFDAMTNDRPYRKALTVENARDIIEEQAGQQFHPQVAKTFIKILDKGLLRGAY